MIISKMFKLILRSIFLYFFITSFSFASDNFNKWLSNFKIKAISTGISEKVVNEIMSDAKFLPKVIEYDRYQPEFYEDTFTYIKKRSSNQKLKKGLELYKKEKSIIKSIEKEFDVEKELLLALMGIETNFGKYLGTMDIVSSLATLSYDKRRSDFFTEELLILLKLVDRNIGVLITDHNVQETLAITDRTYLMFEGKILKSGTAQELSEDPIVHRVYLGKNFELRKDMRHAPDDH